MPHRCGIFTVRPVKPNAVTQDEGLYLLFVCASGRPTCPYMYMYIHNIICNCAHGKVAHVKFSGNNHTWHKILRS